jgi:hypothetical protein
VEHAYLWTYNALRNWQLLEQKNCIIAEKLFSISDYFIALMSCITALKLILVQIQFKNSVRTSKRTPHFTITKINWLTLFKDIIAVDRENHTEYINKKYSVTDCKHSWYT